MRDQGARAGSAPERLWQRGGMGPRVEPEDDAVAGCGAVLRRRAVSAWRSRGSVSRGVAVAPHPEPFEGRGALGIPPGALIPILRQAQDEGSGGAGWLCTGAAVAVRRHGSSGRARG